MSDNHNAEQSQKKETSIILFDKGKNIKYFGKCKVSINLIDGIITIVFKDEALKDIQCHLDRKFICKEYLFCVINNKTNKNMVIFYPNKEHCITSFNAIIKTQQKNSLFQPMPAVDEENHFKTDFFVPILKEIQRNVPGSTDLKTMMFHFVNSLAEEERKAYLNLIAEITLGALGDTVNDDNLKSAVVEDIDCIEISDDESEHENNKSSFLDDTFDEYNASGNDVSNVNEESRFTDFEGAHDSISDIDSDDENNQIAALLSDNRSERSGDNIELANTNEHNSSDISNTYNLRKRSLLNSSFNLIFGDVDMEDSGDDLYNDAEDESDEDDENFDLKKQKAFSQGVSQHFDLSNYEFVEYIENGLLRKKLLVFTSTERTHCYAYVKECSTPYYKCCKCSLQRHRASVKILTRTDGSIKLETGINVHICEAIQYSADDYKSRKTVQLPGYEIAERKWKGKICRKLIVFDSENRNLCHEYSWNNASQYYFCQQCFKKSGRRVYAKLIKNKNGDYVELGRAQHECDLKEYQPSEEITFKTVYKPYFEIITFLKNGKEKKRLSIFDGEDERKIIAKYAYNKSYGKFVCGSCLSRRKYVTAKLLEDENGDEYIQLSDVDHVCKIQEPSIVKTVHKPNFEIESFVKENGKKRTYLTIFDSADRNLFYKYSYNTAKKRFACCSCTSNRKYVSAKLCEGENGNNYIELSNSGHICQPKGARSQSNRACAEKPSNLKTVQKPNFKIKESTTSTGKERKTLIIIKEDDEKFYYKYYYVFGRNEFVCSGCHSNRKRVYAKLCKNENGEECIELSKYEHICKPIPIVKSSIIQKPYFTIEAFQKSNGGIRKQLTIRDQKDSNKIYKFNYNQQNDCFYCSHCMIDHHKHISAKLVEDVNGVEYIKMSERQHFCQGS